MKTWLLLCLLAIGTRAEAADPRYYFYLFGVEDGNQAPDTTHNFATFFKVDGDDISYDIVSWMPRSGKIVVVQMGPERGSNYTMAKSLALGAPANYQIGQWGPYEIKKEFYDAGIAQAAKLRSGEIWYRIMDVTHRIFKTLDPASSDLPPAMMCIHAVSDVTYGIDGRGFLITGKSNGIKAGKALALHFLPWYVLDPNNPRSMSPISLRLKNRMDQILGLGEYRKIRQQSLESVPLKYCKTLDQCRRAFASLLDFF